jgi:hypothetical protein
MWEPDFSSDSFLRDRILSKQRLVDTSDLAACPGGILSGNAVRFAASRQLIVLVRPSKSDLSSFDRLSLRAQNRSHGLLLVGVTLRHSCEDDSDEEGDISVSGGREPFEPGTWRDLKFPVESFGTYGFPNGWHDIHEIVLTFGWERTHHGPDDIEVFLEHLDGEHRQLPVGPRLTSRGLRNVLARDVPGITTFFDTKQPEAPVRPAARIHGSYTPFTADDSALHIPPPHPYPVQTADEILTGRIMGHSIGMPIPWDANPLGVLEWTHFLNRHHFVRRLVQAFVRTGDPKYVVAVDTIVEHWIRSNPVPMASNGGAGPPWETLSAAWRLREWLWIIGTAWSHKTFRLQTKIVMLSSIWEHAQTLMDHKGHPNNWIIVESAALTLAGLCFPEFRESPRWVKTGLDQLSKEFQRQFFRDGVHFEISPLYHAICVQALLEVKQVAEALVSSLPDWFDSALEQSVDYLSALCRPNFTWPSLNDSSGSLGDYTALIRTAGQVYDRPDLAWIGSKGQQGNPPEQGAQVFQDAGIGTMRSGYGRDAHVLVFRAGPPGAAHAHWDTLSLDVTAFGQPRLVDPGITTYAPDPLTEHYRTASAHNTVLINGKGLDDSQITFAGRVQPAGKNFCGSSHGELQFLSGICSGPWKGLEGDCHVTRTVVFVKSEYWIVLDTVQSSQECEVTTCWQFFPGRVEIDLKTWAVLYHEIQGPCFEVIPLLSDVDFVVEIATGLMKPARGWVSMNGSDLPASQYRYTMSKLRNSSFVWLLLPHAGRLGTKVKANRLDHTGHVALEIDFHHNFLDRVELHLPILRNQGTLVDYGHSKTGFQRIHAE